ncbi:hypothetical protein [Flaviflagellibacter deserti]|uniref:Uncharacterized protein n=1 Tax=Flaviflagellibacter deserti TaxID=2267266 RepID=A0ABV9Z3K1_9HYPH
MKSHLLAALLAASTLTPFAAVAQTPPPADAAQPSAPAAPTPAPVAPAAPAAPAVAATPAAPASGPANICTELVAFLTPKPAAPAPASAPATSAQPAGSAQVAPSTQDPNKPTSTPGAPPPAAAASGGSAQQASGQSGTAVEAPKAGPAPAPGQGQNAPQTSGMSAPTPTPPDPPKKQASIKLDEAKAMADANDIPACHAAARKTRREGVDMPPALIALAALDLKYQAKAGPTVPAQ